MAKNMKIRMAVFLCIIMVLPSILSVLPVTSTEVSAASKVSLTWNYNFLHEKNTVVQVEKGQKFYIGDYVYINEGDTYGVASLNKKVSYSSSNKSVAAINAKGLFNAKNTGTTNVTIKYKGKKVTCKIKVVKAGTFGNTDAIKALSSASKKIASDIPSKITSTNGYKYLQEIKDFDDIASKYSWDISSYGFLKEPVKMETYTYAKDTNKLAVPQAGRTICLNALLSQYSTKNSPTSTRSSKMMKIASASASTSQITIKVSKKVSEEQILASNIEYKYYNQNPSKSKASVYMSVYDKTASKNYMGLATITKGSTTVKVKLVQYDYKSDKYISKKLVKGHTYVLGSDSSWEKGKKVIVK